MIPVCIQTLVVASPATPSILVLCPTEDYEKHKSCRIIPIWMGNAEATQVGLALEGKKLERPMTHDLFIDALTHLDARVERVEIIGVKGQTYFSRLLLRCGEKIIDLDARPSDAISLALREEAPLYVTNEVLKKASFPYIFKHGQKDELELEAFHSFVQDLSPEDFSGSES